MAAAKHSAVCAVALCHSLNRKERAVSAQGKESPHCGAHLWFSGPSHAESSSGLLKKFTRCFIDKKRDKDSNDDELC